MTVDELIAEIEARVEIERTNVENMPTEYNIGWLDAYIDVLRLLKGE